MSLKDFQIISKLGEGAYSIVYKVKRVSDGMEYALKKVRMGNLSKKEKENSVNEVRILASFEHPNIVSYKEAFFDDSSSSLCIVMEYADGGDLYAKICEHLKRSTYFPEEQIWKIFIHSVRGLQALHAHNILHRDLKSANVFLYKDGFAKLGDLNVSKIAKKGLLYTQTGTPYYASPEVWKDKPYDSKSDIWSLGCVVYEAVTLKPPFRAQSMEGLNQRVQKGIYPKIQSTYSEELANLIKLMIQVNPNKRPTCEEIMKLPIFVKKSEELQIEELDMLAKGGLLGTIQIPRNLRVLADKLPKPHYKKEELPQVFRNKSIRPEKFQKLGDDETGDLLKSERKINPPRPNYIPSLKREEIQSHPGMRKIDPIKEEQPVHSLLPEIRNSYVPHRKQAPRVYAKKEEDHPKIFSEPLPINRRIGIGEERSNRIQRILEKLEGKKLPAHLNSPQYDVNPLLNPYSRKPEMVKKSSPVIHNNAYHIYQQPIIVRPSWWG